MTRERELAIESLSEASWQRIERGVFDELEARAQDSEAPRRGRFSRLTGVALAGAIAVQLGAAALFWLARSDGTKQPLASTRFESGGEPSTSMLGDVAIRLDPGSALVVVENPARNSLVVLERGAARFSVPHRGERPAFVVQAGDVRVEVVGTQFRVERRGSSARVEAFEGTVRVSAQAETRLLTRGQRFDPGMANATAPVSSTTAAEVVAPAPSKTANETAAEPTNRRASEPSPKLDLQRRHFEQASSLEASAPERALQLYRGLATEKGAWAENALYAMARLELDLGREASAASLLQRYLAEHPQGRNVADARALLAKIKKERLAP